MPNAPHVHTVEETKSNISKIEHNASGPGAPSGKRAGPPLEVAGGSSKNRNSGTEPNVSNNSKGDDWISKRKP